MKIAIIGAGFSGLATGWFLFQQFVGNQVEIRFFDALGIGRGASGVAAGLLHPYVGASAKLNIYGLEGFQTTKVLLELASKEMKQSVATQEGFLRVAISDQQKKDFYLAAERYQDVEWWEAEEIKQKVDGICYHPGIYIKKCITVDCPLYLQGLWKACEERGATFEKKKIEQLTELDQFDRVVLATGALINELLTHKKLSVTQVKGQILKLFWPEQLDALKYPLSSHAYLIGDKKNNLCTIGATYERGFVSSEANQEIAIREILPKATTLIPALQESSVISCKAGLRASTPGHMPIIQHLYDKYWTITGMGSRGLLYHALYAEQLAKMISKDRF